MIATIVILAIFSLTFALLALRANAKKKRAEENCRHLAEINFSLLLFLDPKIPLKPHAHRPLDKDIPSA